MGVISIYAYVFCMCTMLFLVSIENLAIIQPVSCYYLFHFGFVDI